MIKRGDKLPDQQHVREMEEQLEFKGKELQNSEITAVRLRTELDRRSGELDKINSLDNKISTELQQLDTKMKQFKIDIETKYNHVENAKNDGENMLRQLDERRETMQEKVKVMKLQVTSKKLQYDTIKQQLADNETHKALEAQENKLRQIQKSVLYLSTYCASKSGESDYTGMQRNVLDLVEQVNQHLQKQMLQPYSAGAI
jgi:intraflagellar transport protein 74